MKLVDTDVLIAHLRGVEPAREWLRRAREEQAIAVSVVSLAELVGGMRSHERGVVDTLLSSLRPEPVTEEIARHAGRLRRRFRNSHSGIGLGDYLIAATCEVLALQLATLNVRHFPMFPGLRPAFTSP